MLIARQIACFKVVQADDLPSEAELEAGEPKRRQRRRRGRRRGVRGSEQDAVGAEGAAIAQQTRGQEHLGNENQVWAKSSTFDWL